MQHSIPSDEETQALARDLGICIFPGEHGHSRLHAFSKDIVLAPAGGLLAAFFQVDPLNPASDEYDTDILESLLTRTFHFDHRVTEAFIDRPTERSGWIMKVRLIASKDAQISLMIDHNGDASMLSISRAALRLDDHIVYRMRCADEALVWPPDAKDLVLALLYSLVISDLAAIGSAAGNKVSLRLEGDLLARDLMLQLTARKEVGPGRKIAEISFQAGPDRG